MSRARQIVNKLLETGFSKEDFNQLVGKEALISSLTDRGWAYHPDSRFKTWHLTKTVKTGNGLLIDLELYSVRRGNALNLTFYDSNYHLGHLATIPDIPWIFAIQAATDAEDLLSIWHGTGNPDHSPKYQISWAIDDLFKTAQRMRPHNRVRETIDKQWLMQTNWNRDVDLMLYSMNFLRFRQPDGDFVKIIPLMHMVPWSEEKYFPPNTTEEQRQGMTRVGISVGEAFDAYRAQRDQESAYWPLDIKRSVGVGDILWHDTYSFSVSVHHARTVYASQKLGSLSVRIDTVIRALEWAIHDADNGSRYRNEWDFFNAVNRHWGKQPNRIVQPYKRKKK